MAEEEFGTKETEDVVVFFGSICEGIYESVKDGKLTFGDYINFIPVVADLLPAISGIEKVPDELRDLSIEEMDALVEKFKANFEIPDDIVEEFVENCVTGARLVFRNVELFKIWKER